MNPLKKTFESHSKYISLHCIQDLSAVIFKQFKQACVITHTTQLSHILGLSFQEKGSAETFSDHES